MYLPLHMLGLGLYTCIASNNSGLSLTVLQEEELSQSIDISAYNFFDGKLFVVWQWTWLEEEEQSDEPQSKSDIDSSKTLPGDSSPESSSDSEDEVPAITHSVVFKCIGAHKEFHYQELLALAAKKIRDGEIVPVRLREEPNNPKDSRAIAFQCKVRDEWERIGYVVHEALDAVHEALREKKILQVRFDWVKYVVHFRERGWYAGIIINKNGDWPQSVLQCRAKTF